MERLTLDEAIKYIKEVVRKNRKNKEKNTIIIPNSFISSTDCAEKYEQVANWMGELKSYRDIGTLKELKELKENGAFTGLELAKLAIMQKELKEYKDLEEQGLLVRLPCKVGDTVYTLSYRYECKNDYDCKVPRQWKCEENIPCEYEKKIHYVKESKFCLRMLESLGKTVFLTREEAEKALEEMNEK